MSSNPPREQHTVAKVRRMARRAFNKLERIKKDNKRKHSILNKEVHPRSSLDELLRD